MDVNDATQEVAKPHSSEMRWKAAGFRPVMRGKPLARPRDQHRRFFRPLATSALSSSCRPSAGIEAPPRRIGLPWIRGVSDLLIARFDSVTKASSPSVLAGGAPYQEDA